MTIILHLAEFTEHAFIVSGTPYDTFHRQNTETRRILLSFGRTEIANHWMSSPDDDTSMGAGSKL
jgi:hypothetical protein